MLCYCYDDRLNGNILLYCEFYRSERLSIVFKAIYCFEIQPNVYPTCCMFGCLMNDTSQIIERINHMFIVNCLLLTLS